jgi:ABC-type transporter Mla subunit MlaD
LDFGLRIGIQGEQEFRKALADINQNFRVLGSEMALVSSQYDRNDKSTAALAAKSGVLNKEIEQQKEKINTLRAALENAASSFGENDKRTQNWQIALNRAQAELNGMERELEESGKAADNAGGRFEKLGGILKGMGAAIGAAAIAAGAAAVKLGKEVVQQFGELEQNLGGSEAVFGKYAASIVLNHQLGKSKPVNQDDFRVGHRFRVFNGGLRKAGGRDEHAFGRSFAE